MAERCPKCGEETLEIDEMKPVPGLSKKDSGMLRVSYKCTNCGYKGKPG